MTRNPSWVSKGNKTAYVETPTRIPPFRGLGRVKSSASRWRIARKTHIESFRSAPDVSTLCDIVETREALLVQNRVEESQGGQPDAQPIIVQESDQAGHDGRRCRSSSPESGVANPEKSVPDRESRNVRDSLQVSPCGIYEISRQNTIRLRELKARSAYTAIP